MLERAGAILSIACLATIVAAQTPLRTDLVATGLNRSVLATAPPGDSQRLFVVYGTVAAARFRFRRFALAMATKRPDPPDFQPIPTTP